LTKAALGEGSEANGLVSSTHHNQKIGCGRSKLAVAGLGGSNVAPSGG
jgi:hypothetical protein